MPILRRLPKGTATIVAESPKEDPVIAEWMYGLGLYNCLSHPIRQGSGQGILARWEGYRGLLEYICRYECFPSYEDVPYLINP